MGSNPILPTRISLAASERVFHRQEVESVEVINVLRVYDPDVILPCRNGKDAVEYARTCYTVLLREFEDL